MGIGATTLVIVALVVIGWLAYLVLQSRVRHRPDTPAPNLSPYLTDDDLETKRLDRVLLAALIAVAVITVVLPIYYLTETDRQAHAAERFDEIAVERGHEWFVEYQCGDCHGVDGGGGAASYIEARSGLLTTWSAPSINDVLYRYSEDEVRFWLVYGRPGTPMPAWGTDGGGPLNEQQIDELVAYLAHIQVPQADVLSAVQGRVDREITRIANGPATIAAAITAQEAAIAALLATPDQFAALQDIPKRLEAILAGASTCTERTAAAVHKPCDATNADTDRDGVSDAAEAALTDLIAEVVATAPPTTAREAIAKIAFDPADAFTTSVGATPIPDADQLGPLVTDVTSVARDLRLTTQNLDTLLATAENGLQALLAAQEREAFGFDFEAIALAGFDGNVTEAQRAVGLYNAYCARCHTAGWSAGLAFTQEAGSGGFGPSLRDGRSVVQFPNIQDHYDFVVRGSDNAIGYGVNGIGRGWMPGFGAELTRDDLMLIVKLERVFE